jgi:hypothetical protein
MNWFVKFCIQVLQVAFVAGGIGSLLVMVLAAISETRGAVGPDFSGGGAAFNDELYDEAD